MTNNDPTDGLSLCAEILRLGRGFEENTKVVKYIVTGGVLN